MAYGSQGPRPPGSVTRRGATKRGAAFIARWTVRDPDGTKRQKGRSFPTEAAAWKHLRAIDRERQAAAADAARRIRARAAERQLDNFAQDAALSAIPGLDLQVINTLHYLPDALHNAIKPFQSEATAPIIQTFTSVCRTLLKMAHESFAVREVATDTIHATEERIGTALEGMASVRAGGCLADPKGFFVYCLWGGDADRPLYVGQSMNVFARLGAHFGDRKKCDAIHRVSLIRCDTEVRMNATEHKLIRRYQPPWNAVGIFPEVAG